MIDVSDRFFEMNIKRTSEIGDRLTGENILAEVELGETRGTERVETTKEAFYMAREGR